MQPRSAGQYWLVPAMILPPLAWMTFEYGLAATLSPSCETVGQGLGLAWGAAALCMCIAAALSARRCIKAARDHDGASVTAWMGKIALIGSGMFALAITFQSIATVIVPSCAR